MDFCSRSWTCAVPSFGFFFTLPAQKVDRFKPCSPAVFWKRFIWMSTIYLQKCSEMFKFNLQHFPFKYNSIPNIFFGLSFLRCLTSFQPFPMDASVAFGGSGFLRWGWWKCLNFVTTWGLLRPWTVNKVVCFLPGSLVWRIHSYVYASYIVGMVYMHHVWMMYWNRFFKVIRFLDISWHFLIYSLFCRYKSLKEYHTQSTCLED